MAARRINHPNASSKVTRPPATTPEGDENELISLATALAKKQLADGTASAQVTTHYLKLGSSRERLEQARLEHEIALMQAKKEGYESAKRVEEMYGEAMNAFRAYSGAAPAPSSEDDYED